MQDLFERGLPSAQNILDIFEGEWMSSVPGDLVSKPGSSLLFDDDRLKWAETFIGPFKDMKILELGPMEGAHSYMLQQRGAASVTAIEANRRAFMKCLSIKEIFGLSSVSFRLGDFIKYIHETADHYDIAVASGVLYHMTDPEKVIADLARISDRLYLWTHYFDEGICLSSRGSAHFAPAEVRSELSSGAKRFYDKAAMKNEKIFTGGHAPHAFWLTRNSILALLREHGFNNIGIAFDDPYHPHGPSFSVCASRV